MSGLHKEDIKVNVTESDVSLREVGRIIREQRNWYHRQQAVFNSEEEKARAAQADRKFLMSQDNKKHMFLFVAWHKLKHGLASEYEQRLCYEIHKFEMKNPINSDNGALLRGARAYQYWKSHCPDNKDAAQHYIADMDGVSSESVRKQLEKWEKIEAEAENIADEDKRAKFWESVYKSTHTLVKKTLFVYKNPFD